MALLIAVPVGLGVAIFLAELAPHWLRQPLGFLVELLAAVPSVVYGLWGLFAFVPRFVKPLSRAAAQRDSGLLAALCRPGLWTEPAGGLV